MKRTIATAATTATLALIGSLFSQVPASANPVSCQGTAFYQTTVTDRGYFGSHLDSGTRYGTVPVGSVVCAQGGPIEGRHYDLYQENSNLWLEVTFLTGPSGPSPAYIPAVYLTEWNDDELTTLG